MKVSRQQALEILCEVTDQDNFWEMSCERHLSEGEYPDLFDVFAALGISKDEVKQAAGIK